MDLNGDGHADIITGSQSLRVFIFEGKADGKFAERKELIQLARTVSRERGTIVAATDWDGDGDIDLLVGAGERRNKILLVTNKGDSKKYEFDDPTPLTVGEKGNDLKIRANHLAPCAADWDNDGDLDLFVGIERILFYYPNVGTAKSPQLGKRVKMLEFDKTTRVKPCVTDWNEDGYPDLVIGTFHNEKTGGAGDPQRQSFGGKEAKGRVWVYLRTPPKEEKGENDESEKDE